MLKDHEIPKQVAQGEKRGGEHVRVSVRGTQLCGRLLVRELISVVKFFSATDMSFRILRLGVLRNEEILQDLLT
ncbi:protein kinase [Histoplasma capsulatum var. duboisii H88]|uniref:Protein kinase n=1 Tax=Ajellomyces capsulatus (strain H88) TaxID=544711 RepID=A0A8A1LRL1_AJEC8|nr:protein kinase [Histoplasma capsulatum var. duboisii H88]